MLLLAAALSLPMSSIAMMPVVDAGAIANLIRNFNQLKNQYDLLKQTYQQAQQQLEQAKQLTNDAEGHYGFGGLLNGANDLKKSRVVAG